MLARNQQPVAWSVVALLALVAVAGCDAFSLDSLTVDNDLTVGGTIHASAITGNSPLDIQMGGASRIYVDDANGNVGLGTTTPTSLLDVAGDALIQGALRTGGAAEFDGPVEAAEIGHPDRLRLTAGTTMFVMDGTTGTPRVGIGTDAPATNFHVLGYSLLESGVQTPLIDAHDGPLSIRVNTKTSLYLDDNAGLFVGVGTYQPEAKLDVRGKIRSTTEYVGALNSLELSATANFGDLSYWHKVGNTITGGEKMRFTLDTTRMFGMVGIGRNPTTNALEVNGSASKSTAGDWLMNCDGRLKTDVQTVESAVETLDRVRLVGFRYDDDYRAANPEVPDQRYLGVIAQEFRQVFPDYVYESNDKLPSGERILQVDTYPLTIYSAAAVQELHRKMNEREAALLDRIAALEERLAALEAGAAAKRP